MIHGLLARSRAVTVGACVAVAVAVAGCGTTGSSATVTVPDSTLSIYASQPPNGAGSQQTNDVLDAEKLALQPLNQAGDRIGKFTIRFFLLDGKQLSDNARTAVENKSSIAYLGELVPGTSWVSVEITNEEDLLQVSPSDTASFLTQPTAAVPGAPQKYYPSHSTYTPGETFARVVPNSAQEAKAQVQQMQAMHVTKLYIASDGQPYGATIALEVKQAAAAAGISASRARPQRPASPAPVRTRCSPGRTRRPRRRACSTARPRRARTPSCSAPRRCMTPPSRRRWRLERRRTWSSRRRGS